MENNDKPIRCLRLRALFGSVSLLAIVAMQQSARAQQATTPIPDITVNAPPPAQPLDGSAAAGYRVKDSTAAGPIWGDLPVLDTPYSISVVPHELIQNTQANAINDLIKVLPQLQASSNASAFYGGNGTFGARGQTMGTQTGGVTFDGLSGGVGGIYFPGTALEDTERVELLSGVAGFLYGTGFLAGNLNFALKRPTETPLYDVTIGDNAGRNTYIHTDFGGPLNIPGLADGLLAYRLNIVGQDGKTSIADQSIKRNLISGALDIHLWDGALLQLDASHSNYHVYGTTPEYNSCLFGQACHGQTGSLFGPVAPINPADYASPSWTQFTDETDKGGVKLTWKLNDTFTWRTRFETSREQVAALGQNTSISGTVLNYSGADVLHRTTQTIPTFYYSNSGYSYLDSTFSTFGIDHKVTTGFNGFTQTSQGFPLRESLTNGAYFSNNFYNPSSVSAAIFSYSPQTQYISRETFAKNFILGDEMKFFDGRFIILAGANYTTLGSETFNTNGTIASGGYDKSALTPTVSLVYKPLPWFTTYATFQQSLQSGLVVPNTSSYTDPGQVLAPYLGESYEIGAKAQVGTNLLLTAALYHLTKANQYFDNSLGTTTCSTVTPCTYHQDGKVVDKGIELTAIGKMTPDLTVVAGLNFLDARVTSNPSALYQVGTWATTTSAVGQAPISGKLYAEYNIPFFSTAPFLHGLVLIGGVHGQGAAYDTEPTAFTGPNAQIVKTSPFVVCDLGFRYTTAVYDHPLIMRFNVNNVANHAYWLIGSPGIEGPPRTFLASAEMKW